MRKIAAGNQLPCLGVIQFWDGFTGSCGEVKDKRHLHLSRNSTYQKRLELILHGDLLLEGRKLSIII